MVKITGFKYLKLMVFLNVYNIYIFNFFIYFYYIKLKSRLSVCLSVCPSTFFLVTPITRSSRLGSTQDLVCVMAVSSGTSKFVFISL